MLIAASCVSHGIVRQAPPRCVLSPLGTSCTRSKPPRRHQNRDGYSPLRRRSARPRGIYYICEARQRSLGTELVLTQDREGRKFRALTTSYWIRYIAAGPLGTGSGPRAPHFITTTTMCFHILIPNTHHEILHGPTIMPTLCDDSGLT